MTSTDSTPDPDPPTAAIAEMNKSIKCNQVLSDLGLEATIKLPRVVLVSGTSLLVDYSWHSRMPANQFSGKSSLVEALAYISVPRDAGCCTKCPIEINLSGDVTSASAFECKVYHEFKLDQNPVDETFSDIDPVWQSTRLLRVTNVRTEIHALIWSAQDALLDNEQQRSATKSRAGRAKFSSNIIGLDITQKGLPKLSFIDLLGIIASTGKVNEKSYVEFIDGQGKGYANDRYAVVLLALAMTKDMVSSKSRAVLQDISAGDRVLPVFTKPDVLQKPLSSEYLQMFLGHGASSYGHKARIVMMNPNFDLVYTEARKFECDFFSQAPCKSVDESHHTRLGVENLRPCLQQILFAKTRETLPQNISQIANRLDSPSKQLAGIQTETDAQDIPLIIKRETTRLERYLRKVFDDSKEADEGTFLYQYTSFAAHFRKVLVASHPRQVLLSNEEEGKGNKTKKDLPPAAEPRKGSAVQELIVLSSD
jgi:hypothetical protein